MAQTQEVRTNNIFNKPRVIIPIAAVVAIVIGFFVYRGLSTTKNYATTPVAYGNVTSELTSTGTVKAGTSIDLAFPIGGRISYVNAKVGQQVTAGTTLASIDSESASGAVAQAQAAYQAAEANYQLLIAGASSSDIAVAQSAVNSAQVAYQNTVSAQKVAVANAYQTLLSSNLVATSSNSAVVGTPTISGTYTLGTEGTITITAHPAGNNGYFSTTGLVTTTGNIDPSIPQPIGNTGLFVVFPQGANTSPTSWTISIPNTDGPSYTANLAAYTTAQQTQTNSIAQAQAAVDAANASLAKVQAAPQSQSVAQAQAQVAAAQGALESAQGALANYVISAPISGVISYVNDIAAGDIATPNAPVIGIMSENSYQIESYISQNDLGIVSIGQPVSIVTDAYGPDVVFNGTIVEIAPAATTQADGTSGYKITYQFTDKDPRIKAGLSATVTIQGGNKQNVLVVPNTAIFLQNGKPFVLVKEGKKNVDTPITTGLVGNDTTEVTSGLTAGEQVVTLGQ